MFFELINSVCLIFLFKLRFLEFKNCNHSESHVVFIMFLLPHGPFLVGVFLGVPVRVAGSSSGRRSQRLCELARSAPQARHAGKLDAPLAVGVAMSFSVPEIHSDHGELTPDSCHKTKSSSKHFWHRLQLFDLRTCSIFVRFRSYGTLGHDAFE